MEKITIVGGGNGAFAASADLTLRGNQVTLFELPQFAGGIKDVMERGGIEMESFAGNGLEGGFAKLYKITTDVKEALAESDIIMVIVPSYSLDTIAKLCAPYLRDGQIVALCPANFGGSLFFSKTVKDSGYDPKILIADFACMMYACRKNSPSSVWVRGYKHNLGVALFPNKGSEPAFERLHNLYPYIVRYNNVIETGLSNPNSTMHTSIMLFNAACVDNKEDRLFYRECVTPSLNNMITALDKERCSLNSIKGMHIRTIPQILTEWYGHQGAQGETMCEILHSLKHFAYSKLPTEMTHRYVTEDVPYGLIPSAEFFEQLGLEHPLHTALANVLSAVSARDFKKEARTLKDIGIDGMNADQLMHYLETGERI